MELYIKIGSLYKFQKLFDGNEYLQKVLKPTNSNVYLVDTDDLTEIVRLLESNRIKYKFKD